VTSFHIIVGHVTFSQFVQEHSQFRA